MAGRTAGEQITPKFKAIFIDASFNGSPTNYVRLGKDLEEYSKALNPDVETKKNILEESTVKVKGYSPESSIGEYYAYEQDPLFEKLDAIANDYAVGSRLDTTIVEVLLDTDGTVCNAFRENVKVIPQEQKIDTTGYNIPFNIYYNGDRVAGIWDNDAKTFTVPNSLTQ